jgi:hypothetical protein
VQNRLVIALALAAAACGRTPEPAEREAPPALAHDAPATETPASRPAAAPAPAPAPAPVAAPVVHDDEDEDAPEKPTTRALDDDDDDERPRAKKKRARSEHAEGGGLKVKRLQFASSVAGREPGGVSQSFAAATDVYAYVEVNNTLGEPTHISVTFVSPKKTASKVALDVGDSARWRTWAKRRVGKDAGTWQVIVRDEGGRTLASGTFEVK